MVFQDLKRTVHKQMLTNLNELKQLCEDKVMQKSITNNYYKLLLLHGTSTGY